MQNTNRCGAIVVQFFLLTATFFNLGSVCAQIYNTEGKNRYTFAQSTFGYDFEFTPAGGYAYYRNNGNLEKVKLGNVVSPTISITGLHFWGHAEFFTGFSVGQISLAKNGDEFKFKRSAATGGKYFPLALQTGKLRPYIGSALSSYAYQQANGSKYRRAENPWLLGATYLFKRGLLEVGAIYHYQNKLNYYISLTERVRMRVPQVSFNIDYKYFFDLSKNSIRREREGELKEELAWMTERKALNTLSVAAGPAYSFFTAQSSYNKKTKPFLDDHQITNIFPDIGLGYYLYKPDLLINFSWRFYTSRLEAYGFKQTANRHSLAIEVLKFIGDYHGFVPFVGLIASREQWRVREVENAIETFNKPSSFLAPGINVGWDIRATRTDWWSVRTNIRYFPTLKMNMGNGQSLSLQQIELNFLQMVLYPNRIAANARKK